MMAIALNDFITYAILARATYVECAMVLMRGMLALRLATVIIKIGILPPLGASGTTEKMLVACHASKSWCHL